jgi:lipopolysaccharide export system protein LptA
MPPAMPIPSPFRILCLAAALVVPGMATAEKADRGQPMVVESDGGKAATVDLARKVTVMTGNVVITQGTLKITADRVEIQEPSPGRYVANALGAEGHLATYRQKRDEPGEYVEAQGLRIDYDGGSDRVKFTGLARLRVLRDGKVTDEANADVITYDQKTEVVNFAGGPPASPGAPLGRARITFAPRPAASAPAQGASAASPASGAAAVPAVSASGARE